MASNLPSPYVYSRTWSKVTRHGCSWSAKPRSVLINTSIRLSTVTEEILFGWQPAELGFAQERTRKHKLTWRKHIDEGMLRRFLLWSQWSTTSADAKTGLSFLLYNATLKFIPSMTDEKYALHKRNALHVAINCVLWKKKTFQKARTWK